MHIMKQKTGRDYTKMPGSLFCRVEKMYLGPLSTIKARIDCAAGIRIYASQKSRAGVRYGIRHFIYWYIKNLKKKSWKFPHVARHDHNKPYSFDNIFMQEAKENIQERNDRLGNPCKTHRKVRAIKLNGEVMEFETKKDAAKHFKCSEKTVYNHAMKRTKLYFKYGPKTERTFYFEWIDDE